MGIAGSNGAGIMDIAAMELALQAVMGLASHGHCSHGAGISWALQAAVGLASWTLQRWGWHCRQ